ncbi:DUF4349 domain-containing protein [Microbacterium sp. No. 7]|uniref:DUF4349 domain-containing protein n=1 Tax=Microbacterium sp. No. 7 TaxID=1714373 RepID=UPI0006D19FD7|nr:DUF4349 domain-containing protein [Microbacterium sp. No. 7]ALJ20104.1 hypothetical protein AOA12_09355 [Microbacterium sp. No. 7]
MNDRTIALPPLSEARIDEIEDALFDRIARDDAARRSAETRRTRRRGRAWAGGLAAAGIVAVAAFIGPQLVSGGISGGMSADSSAAESAPMPADGSSFMGGSGLRESSTSDSLAVDPELPQSIDGVKASELVEADAPREVIVTASASVEVDDIDTALEAIQSAVTSRGGFVENMSVGDGGSPVYDSGAYAPDVYSAPASSHAWITVRVPSDVLTEVNTQLREIGRVTASQIDRNDVTTQAIDLRARVASLEASVERLTTLMGEAGSTADLLAAESALSQRQAELDSYRQQLTYLEGQVQLSTLSISLSTPAPPVKADPAGFGDGLAAGWNGFVATVNGIVIGLGFLLPWLVAAAVVLFIVIAVRRVRRARRTDTKDTAAPPLAE